MKHAVADALSGLRDWMESPDFLAAPMARHEVALPDVDPLRWLQVQSDPVKGFWSARDEALQVAALGEADVLKGSVGDGIDVLTAHIARRIDGVAGARYFGGFRFGPPVPNDPTWLPFGTYRFVLPRFELLHAPEGTRLACNVVDGASRRGEYLQALQALSFEHPPAFVPLGDPQVMLNRPDRAEWRAMVEGVKAQIASGSLSKVVLARQHIMDFGQPLEPFSLLSRLRGGSPECYLFGGVHAGRVAFMGAPPERLYRRVDRRIETEAVAGTRPRGKTPAEDRAFASELASSQKDQFEHRLVVESITQALRPLCDEWMNEGRPRVVKFRTVQHLVTLGQGRLRPGIGDADILSALHPTAAVAGHPHRAAMDAISRTEPFDRGWYSGPVGWIAADAAEFAVAIRCGIVAGSKLCLFAGAGIMADSDAELEWLETEAKLKAFIATLQTT